MIASIVITILLIIILSCFGYILYLKYIKKYTRERFAFFGVTAMVTLIAAFIAQIYSSQGFVTAFINTTNFVSHSNFSTYKTDFKDHILTFIVLAAFMQLIFKLHKNWDGPISETLYNKRRYHENSTIFNEGYIQLKDFLSKEKIIEPYTESKETKHFNIFTPAEDDKTPWYESVFELLTFSSIQYKIELQADYYKEEKVFVSKFGQNNDPIAIFCYLENPSGKDMDEIIQFCKKRKRKFLKIIVAVKNELHVSQIVKYNDLEMHFRYENEMLNSLVDFSSYHQFIKDQFSSREITFGTGKTLKDIYVELKGKTDDNVLIPEMEKYITDWLEITDDNKHLAILGEYGCGKSVLSIKITHKLLENRTENSRIPILIELRGKSPRNLNVTEILSTWASNFRLEASSILKLHKSGKLLIIFEGFDEMDMIGDREMRLNHFQRLWEFAMPKAKIIITGRPNFFLDDKELKINLGIDKPFETSHYCEAIHLEKFTTDQIKHALRNIDFNTRKQVIEIVERSNNSNFYDLVSRPAILYLVGVIWKERKLSDIKDKINSAIVISEFIKYSYSRQSNKNASFPLSEKEREYFMYGVAVGMLRATEYSNQINKNELENIILKLYKKFPNEITPITNATQPQRKLLKERMIDNNQDEDTILTDVRSCGILVNDLTRKDYFKFAHKSFLEYQVSLYFVESILQDKGEYNIIMNSISNALEITSSNFYHSQETIFFTAEILISKLTINNTEDPKTICKKLFYILYPNKFLGRHPKIAAFVDMHFASGTNQFFLFSIALFFSMFIIFSRNKFPVYTITLSMIIISLIYTYSIAKRRLHKVSNKRTSIWLKCCHKLNIPESTISEIVSKNYILYLNDRYSDPLTLLMKVLFRIKNRNSNNQN